MSPPERAGADPFFELSLDLLAVAGFDGQFRRLNPMWTRTLGWSKEELFSRPIIEFVHPEDRERTLAARAGLKQGVPATALTNRYLCKDGSHRWLEWRSVSDVQAQVVYATARDVTQARLDEADRHRQREQLLSAERMASVGRLAAKVAHELNNPLAFILANLHAASNELASLPAPAEHRQELCEMLAESEQGAERIRVIVQGLSSFAQFQKTRGGPIHLADVLRQAMQLVSHELQHSARVVEAFGETPMVNADPASLTEVFANLLSNAAKAFRRPLSTRNEIRIRTWRDENDHAVVEVSDDGVGIPLELQATLFEPLSTRQERDRSLGLGLSLCHGLITEMGGTISFTSALNEGTTFRVTLPSADAVSGTAPTT